MIQVFKARRERNRLLNRARDSAKRGDFGAALDLIRAADGESRHPTNRVIALMWVCKGARDERVAAQFASIALDGARPLAVRNGAVVAMEGMPFDSVRDALRRLQVDEDSNLRWLAGKTLATL